MKLSLETAQAFVDDAQARINVARTSGATEVEIEFSAREAAVNALDEAQAEIDKSSQSADPATGD